MTRDHAKRLIPTLILATFATAFLAQPSNGLWLPFLMLGLLIFIPVRLYSALREPDERLPDLGGVAIWVISITLIFGIHHFRAQHMQAAADSVAKHIEQYIAHEGHCPESISGWTNSAAEYLRYSCDHGAPFLYYRDTYSDFDTHDSNFSRRAWEFHPD